MADMAKAVRALRDTLDDLLEEMTRSDDEGVELTITIAANGTGLPRTRAFIDGRKLRFSGSGTATVTASPGSHRLIFDVQGARNLEYTVSVAAGSQVLVSEKLNLGDDGEDGGAFRFDVS